MIHATRFHVFSRALHWLMAVLVLAMLFIGIGMVGSLAEYHRLVSIHRPLGILVLLLVIVRLINRWIHPPPPLQADMPAWQRAAALGSHVLLYALLFALPIAGWGMLSAGNYPIVPDGPMHLPPILPHSAALYAVLCGAHTLLAFVLFAIILAHLAAALMHALIYRDGVFQSMAPRNAGAPHSRGKRRGAP